MKDATITVRLPGATRARVERLARSEGRSLSGQVERLIERGLTSRGESERVAARALAGLFRGGPVPTLEEFRGVRAELSTSLAGRRKRP